MPIEVRLSFFQIHGAIILNLSKVVSGQMQILPCLCLIVGDSVSATLF